MKRQKAPSILALCDDTGQVLVLHRPLALLDEAVAKRVLSVLRTFVRERGLALDPETRSSRRLRTVVFSCRSLDQALEIADDVIVAGMPNAGASMFTAEQLNADNDLRERVVATISHDGYPMLPTYRHEAPPSPSRRAVQPSSMLSYPNVHSPLGV
jgi:ABC-type cobalamin/Fe3+-siderophores transport system ATPase subunit